MINLVGFNFLISFNQNKRNKNPTAIADSHKSRTQTGIDCDRSAHQAQSVASTQIVAFGPPKKRSIEVVEAKMCLSDDATFMQITFGCP